MARLFHVVLLQILFASVFVLAIMSAPSLLNSSANFTIRKTWDNQTVSEEHHVHISFRYETDLSIKISAPFYDNPRLPDMTKNPGTMDKLYNFEVVEVFLLGADNHYLEIELGPRGQYLVLELKGYRNVTRYPIDLPHYHSRVEGKRWTASTVVSNSLLPYNITHFNAYAIHGSEDKRQYLSLFPAPHNHSNYRNVDFHRLELFEPISIFSK